MTETPGTTFPRGWFVVAFSSEIKAGEAKDLLYFGERLVAFRGEDGVVRVLEGYCAHMGARLAAGGVVKDNCIRCPFHHWKFDGTGACVEIPYAKRIPVHAKQKSWTVREFNGVVLLWHDPAGGDPDFEVPVIAEHGTASWLPWSEFRYEVKTHPREIVENLADRGHFPAVHSTDIHDFSFSVDGITATQKVKGTARLPDGGADHFSSSTTYHGPGLLLMKMDGALQNWMIVAHTPIDATSLHLRLGVMLKIVGSRERTEGYVAHYLANLKAGFEDDLRIWETKLFRERPVLCDGDGPIMQLRRWYRQFYEPRATTA